MTADQGIAGDWRLDVSGSDVTVVYPSGRTGYLVVGTESYEVKPADVYTVDSGSIVQLQDGRHVVRAEVTV